MLENIEQDKSIVIQIHSKFILTQNKDYIIKIKK